MQSWKYLWPRGGGLVAEVEIKLKSFSLSVMRTIHAS